MHIEIAGKNYQIITTDAKNIRLEVQHDTATIFAPADIDINTLEQFVKNYKISTILTEEVQYNDQPLQLFQQSYLLKIIKNSSVNKIQLKNRTVTLHCKVNTAYQNQLKAWQKQFILQQLSDLIGYWEEQLEVLVNEIKLRSMTKSLYAIKPHNSITFGTSISCLSIPELKYLTFKAISEAFAVPPNIRAAYFPEEQLMQHQITYSLKTCQQSH